MIEVACHVVAHCCSSLAEEVVSAVFESLGGPTLASDDPVADARRLAHESAAEQFAFDRYMQGRDTTTNEWILRVDPLAQDLVALSPMAKTQDGDRT